MLFLFFLRGFSLTIFLASLKLTQKVTRTSKKEKNAHKKWQDKKEEIHKTCNKAARKFKASYADGLEKWEMSFILSSCFTNAVISLKALVLLTSN